MLTSGQTNATREILRKHGIDAIRSCLEKLLGTIA